MLVPIPASQVGQLEPSVCGAALILLGHPKSGTFLVIWLLPIPDEVAFPGRWEVVQCPCQQQDVRDPSCLILLWVPAGYESCLRNGDVFGHEYPVLSKWHHFCAGWWSLWLV